ncbi:MAG: TfoX/Sxy family protein, partial [Steroidobacter sp.]
KMFGEYAVYCDEKVVALVCDNQFYVKVTDAAVKILDHVTQASPFPGAKPWIVADEYLDDAELITRLIRNTAAILPVPKTKKPRKKAAARKK